MMIRRFLVQSTLAIVGATTALPALAAAPKSYLSVLTDTGNMVNDARAQRLAQQHGLDIVNVTWEDTGRYKGSSVGPNISDMTIQVQHTDNGQTRLHLMPVIRFPNFSDTTGDVPLDKFTLLVGNEDGKGLRRVSLKEFLGDIRSYLNKPGSWKGDKKSLLAARDTAALVSAQAAFLPIPKGGEATFNPVLFNYQSVQKDPAVLTILATREGTSVTIIDNVRDGFAAGGVWGQRLFFNQNGQRASLTGKRASEHKVEGKPAVEGAIGPSAGENDGLNMVLLIQVPLKQKQEHGNMVYALAAEMEDAKAPTERGGSDVENAVIGHGALEGPFTEIDGLDIERDDRFPVRVTVQFYKATSNGEVSATDLLQIKSQIDRVYKDATYVGSLVTGGDTGRPTEYAGDKFEPDNWWQDFWARHSTNVGMSPDQIRWQLDNLYTPNWVARPGSWWSRGPLAFE